jgi:hypothetical protein
LAALDVEKVGAAAGADEEGVSGEDPARQEDRDEVLGVSGGVEKFQGKRAQA